MLRSLFLVPCALLAASPVTQLHVKVPMRDGVQLCTNVFRPAQPSRVPVVLIRTPYGKGWELSPSQRAFLDHGYALVIQDVRGRYDSGGRFQPVVQEANDGYDTIDWLTRQPWCDGNVGMSGGSYLGIAQWRAAIAGHPGLKAIVPVHAGWDEYTDRYYSPGGAFKLGHRLVWLAQNMRRTGTPMPDLNTLLFHTPLRTSDVTATGQTIDFFQEVLDHPEYDSFWQSRSTREQIDRVKAAVFVVAGWYDNYAESDIAAYQALRQRKIPTRLLVGAWGHNMTEKMTGVKPSEAQVPALRMLEIEWFDAFLRRGSPPKAAPVRVFITGANRWADEEVWPPKGLHPITLNLASGSALKNAPEANSTTDRFDYNPRRPVPTRGGAICCNYRLLPWGPLDQRSIGVRTDVLSYSSEVLAKDLEVSGPVQVTLYVASSAPDTDFTAKLIDLAPSGEARIVCDGILRLRFRQSLGKTTPYSPGSVVKIEIDAGVTSHLFRAGNRIKLDVSSSNFPRFDRNPNTGGAIEDEREFRTARQAVLHDRLRPSHLTLLVNDGRIAGR
jgi:putative CocE/NonD family hydrolase